MLVIWAVGIVVPLSSGRDAKQFGIIVTKGIILLSINCMMKYAYFARTLLQNHAAANTFATPWAQAVPWAQTAESTKTVLGVLCVFTLAFTSFDLLEACGLSPKMAYVIQQIKRSISNAFGTWCSPGQDEEQDIPLRDVHQDVDTCSPGQDEEEEIPLRDVYQDMDTCFACCMQRFALTVVFVICYWSVCIKAQEPTLRSQTFWYLSLLVQIHFAESCSKSGKDNTASFRDLLRWACCADLPYEPQLWKLLFRSKAVTVTNEEDEKEPNEKKPEEDEKKPNEKEPLKCGKFELTCRFILSYISNGLLRVIVLYTLPIFLSRTTDEKDFALNAFAVTFIVELDNLTSDKKVKTHKAKASQEAESEAPLLEQSPNQVKNDAAVMPPILLSNSLLARPQNKHVVLAV